jgi:hypothetical protein
MALPFSQKLAAGWLLSGTLHEMPAELRAVVDKGFLYHNAKKVADDRRENNLPVSKQEADQETLSAKISRWHTRSTTRNMRSRGWDRPPGNGKEGR